MIKGKVGHARGAAVGFSDSAGFEEFVAHIAITGQWGGKTSSTARRR